MTETEVSNIGLRRMGLSVVLALIVLCAVTSLIRTESAVPVKANPVSVGLVTDGPTIDDKSFNWLSYQGLLQAQSELGIVGKVYTSTSSDDYEPNLQRCVNEGNNLCLSVGFLLADATLSKAAANAGTEFTIVDYAWSSYPPNLRGMVFASDEVGYLAGTLAAHMSQSDIVGSVGGMQIPPVDQFIYGYRNGARCANPDVTVIVSYTNDFGNPELGAQVAQGMLAQGADVIFAAAGPTGYGAVLTATQSGAWGIGVDVDYYDLVFMSGAVSGSNKLLTSAMKRVDNAVFDTIGDVVSGTFTSGTAFYDLAVDGVGLAPFHETASSIPQTVRDELDRVERGIISGTIDVKAPCGKYVGLVTDENALADRSFNWLSYQGLLRAQSELGVAGTVYTSTSSADYAPNLRRCVDDGNALCISVGFLTSGAIESAATANAGTRFAIVDFAWISYSANLRGLTFASDEVGYLAGTLAGLMSTSDVVGNIGGMSIPPVDLFVNGYRNGARCANPDVTVIVSYTNDFYNPELGAQVAQGMLAQGADVIFAAAGPTGYGAVLTATQSGAWGIGVDVDYYDLVFMSGAVSGSNKLLTSAMKRVDNAVFDTVADAISGTFTSGTVVYDLAADGVGLAPFHETDPFVPQAVRGELARVSQGIISNTLDVNGPCQSRVYLPAIMKNK